MRLDDASAHPRGSRGTPPTTAQQGIIRLALLVGVLLFGGVCWWLTRDGSPPLSPSGGP